MKKHKNCIICNAPLHGKQSKFCSKNCKNKDHQVYQNQQKRGLERKLKLIQKVGKKCSMCGYSKNLAALTFHHLNPKNKKFKLDIRSLSNRRFESILLEHRKCILICHNCHAELHNPGLALGRLLCR